MAQRDAGKTPVFSDVLHELLEGGLFEVSGVFPEQVQFGRRHDFKDCVRTEDGGADLLEDLVLPVDG